MAKAMAQEGRTLMRPLILAAAFTGLATAGHAQTCHAIHFAHGASAAVVRGTAGWDDPATPCFTLGVRRGQTVSVRVLRPDGNTAFSVVGVVDDQDRYSFTAPSSDIRFSVFETLRAPATPFAIEVQVY